MLISLRYTVSISTWMQHLFIFSEESVLSTFGMFASYVISTYFRKMFEHFGSTYSFISHP